MPDVKWYGSAGGSLTISTTVVSGGTNNRLLRQTGGVVGNSLLSDDGTNVTLSSGILNTPAGSTAAPSLSIGSAASDFGFYRGAAGVAVGTNRTTDWIGLDTGIGVRLRDTFLLVFDAGTALSGSSTAGSACLKRTASSVLGVYQNDYTNFAEFRARGIGVGMTPVASEYLCLNGVSGAGGTPTTAQLTAGSGVAIYTQQAHDAAATALVFAYNLGGSMRYISIPLDGTTATWTHNATRP